MRSTIRARLAGSHRVKSGLGSQIPGFVADQALAREMLLQSRLLGGVASGAACIFRFPTQHPFRPKHPSKDDFIGPRPAD